MSVEWRWRAGMAGYAAHLGSWTAWVQLETREARPEGPDGPIFRVPAPGSSDADAFAVAIVGPGQERAERYRLRGSLAECQAKLSAALRRRAGGQ